MSFCRECGHALNSDNQFCPECGKPVEGAVREEPTVAVTVQETTTVPRKPMSKKQKFTLFTSGAIIILLAITYFVLKHFASVDFYLDQFEKAVQQEDKDSIVQLVHSFDSRVDVTEESAKDLLAYLKNDPFYKNELFASLRDQAADIENVEIEPYVDGNVLLKKSGKKFLFFDNYEIQLLPYFIEVETNYADASILIDGKEVGKSDSDYFLKSYGPYLPGEYQVKVEYKSELASLDYETTVNLFESSSQTRYVDMWLEGYYLDVYVDDYEAGVYLDGNFIGTYEELGSIGPIDIDGSHTIHVEKEFPWGTVQSEVYDITDTYYEFYVDPITDDLRTEIAQTIYDFEVNRFHSLQTLDSSVITASAEYKEELANEIQYYIDDEYMYYGTGLNKVTVDKDSLSTYFDGDYYEIEAAGMIEWTGDMYYIPSVEESGPEYLESITTETQDNLRNYFLLYNHGTGAWEVAGLSWSPYSSFDIDGGLVVFDVNQ
ncbi:hypothetical protein GCM10008967_03220 [Bacillus carboniphilus]|uniref:Zinc-ribbon domain-containing protein n=1 Tax=Bacillus carboniphilus TaxID=86663 RepID=A0ABN0VST0_9BACI